MNPNWNDHIHCHQSHPEPTSGNFRRERLKQNQTGNLRVQQQEVFLTMKSNCVVNTCNHLFIRIRRVMTDSDFQIILSSDSSRNWLNDYYHQLCPKYPKATVPSRIIWYITWTTPHVSKSAVLLPDFAWWKSLDSCIKCGLPILFC